MEFFINLFGRAGADLWVFLMSMLPIVELRGAIPLAAASGLLWYEALPLCVLGNMVPVPFIIWLVRPLFNWFKTTKALAKVAHFFEGRALKNADKVKKYSLLGLMLIVAIPLPGTGAWTGSLLAVLMDLRLKPAFLAIFLGVVLAGIVMTLLSYGFLNVAQVFT